MKFLTTLDMTHNEVINLTLHKNGGAPSGPVEGQIYYDTGTKKVLYRDNVSFKTLIDSSVSFITSVTASSPLASSGGSTPDISLTGTIAVGNGGTGQTALTIHGVLIGNATSGISVTAAGTAGQALVSGGPSADPAFASSGGDITGIYTNLTVNTVGGASSTNIADAVTKRHTQNTDTGTTSATFLLDSAGTGVKLKDEAGLLSVRNAADGADADMRVRDLTVRNFTVTGTPTIIQSNTVSIGDSLINLNEDITAAASNDDGGVAVTRLAASTAITNAADNGSGLIRITSVAHGLQTGDRARINSIVGTVEANSTPTNPSWVVTRIDADNFDLVGSTFANAWVSGGTSAKRIDAKMYWNESSARWESRVGSETAPASYTLGRKMAFPVGDASALTFDLVHSMNTRDFTVSARRTGTPWDHVFADVEALDLNTARVTFASAPALNEYTVTIIG